MLRDAVHGDVYLSHEELLVLDTPEMQRLRGIKQLGTASLVYPCAVHTRFDHSIGVLHLTGKLVEAINRNAELDPRGSLAVTEKEQRIVRMAALVHDVTHIPFGHGIEDQTGLFRRHDTAYRFERMLDAKTALGSTLERLSLRQDVLATLVPQGTPGHAAVPAYWRQIMSDTIGADLLDYLQRDAHFTGLRIAVDPRVLSYFRVDRASANLAIDLAKRDLLREDILSEIVRVLEARYTFSERVYYHHAKVSAGALVARAAELCLLHGLMSEADFYDQTDASLLERFERSAEGAPTEVARRVRALVSRFRERRLLKRVCVFPRYENASVQAELVERFFSPGRHRSRVEVEERIADLVRFATGRSVEVILYCPAAKMQLKEAQTHVRWPGDSEVRPLSVHGERVPRLADLERSYRDLWKFYVFADATEPRLLGKIQQIALSEFPGAKNVYRIEGAA